MKLSLASQESVAFKALEVEEKLKYRRNKINDFMSLVTNYLNHFSSIISTGLNYQAGRIYITKNQLAGVEIDNEVFMHHYRLFQESHSIIRESIYKLEMLIDDEVLSEEFFAIFNQVSDEMVNYSDIFKGMKFLDIPTRIVTDFDGKKYSLEGYLARLEKYEIELNQAHASNMDLFSKVRDSLIKQSKKIIKTL